MEFKWAVEWEEAFEFSARKISQDTLPVQKEVAAHVTYHMNCTWQGCLYQK